ncbi:MAG: CidA/LrgA family protein [Bacteroidales bacterium]|nr:CidA/LrgA family protein [Bacteroidales bacterium]MDD4657394.1 CidA/LrgA family protein [Bacteroidales bacterium]
MILKKSGEFYKLLSFILGAAIIVVSYYIGEFLSYLILGFISPAVMGMLVLFGLLKSGVIKPAWVELASNFLLENLMLFFIPATAGVALVPFSAVRDHAAAILISVIVSTFLVLWIVGYVIDIFEFKRDVNQKGSNL